MTMANEERICTVEDFAALKFAAVQDSPFELPDLETWVKRAKYEYAVYSLCLPLLNLSDAELERKIRSHEDTWGYIEALQDLTKGAMSLAEKYQASAETMEGVYVRLLAVLARFTEENAG